MPTCACERTITAMVEEIHSVYMPCFNPYLTNGFSHRYHLGESTFILGVSGVSFFFSLFDEMSLFKQNSPRWDAAFCGVTSVAILFAYVPKKGLQA